jgi:hypothetical protein
MGALNKAERRRLLRAGADAWDAAALMLETGLPIAVAAKMARGSAAELRCQADGLLLRAKHRQSRGYFCTNCAEMKPTTGPCPACHR